MACNEKCITQEQLYNLLDNYDFSANVVPIGARLTVGLDTFNEYFDSTTGLGSQAWEGWAISNGANGTVNRFGKFPAFYDPTNSNFSTIDSTGGAESVTLSTSELPTHSHSYGLPAHTHTVTDPGHSHSISTNTQLASAVMGGAGGTTVNVNTAGLTVTLNKQQLRIEDSVAPTNPKDIEIYVPAVDLQAYGGLTSGTEAENITGTGTVTLSDHTHSLSLGHSHTNTASTSTTGISIDNNNADAGGSTTQTTGSGQPFSILPPYVVEVPVEKIA